MDEPLIYTARGNLPVASLKYAVEWEDTPDYTKMIETYTLDGEVVKQSVHVFGRRQIEIGSLQASF